MGLGYALSDAALLTTDLDEAQRLAAEADQLLRATGTPIAIAHNVERRGIIAYDRDELADAAAFVAEAVEIFNGYGNLGCSRARPGVGGGDRRSGGPARDRDRTVGSRGGAAAP